MVKPMNRIIQRSVGFHFRQLLFFAQPPSFKPDQFCRNAIDEQIKLIDPNFLE